MLNLILIGFFLAIAYTVALTFQNGKVSLDLYQKEYTETVRGIASLMIMIAHIIQYKTGYVILWGGGITQRFTGSWGAIGVSIFFFLSGYGNYLSLSNQHSRIGVIRKTIFRVIRLVIVFFLCFVAVGIVRMIMTKMLHIDSITIGEFKSSLATLCMVGTSTWYLKIQILYYIVTAVSFIIFPPKYRNIVIFLCVIIYIIIAIRSGLSDYWWKTALCYPVGSLCAEYKYKLNDIVIKYKMGIIVGLLISAGCAYLWIIKDRNYIIIPQLIAYTFISSAAITICSIIQMANKTFSKIGRASLPIYLVHIGLANGILSESGNANMQIIIFCILTALLSIIIQYANQRISDQLK